MTHTGRVIGQRSPGWVVLLAVAVLLAGGTLVAQPEQRLPEPAPDQTPDEIERLFDAFVLVQAQEALGLSDDQFIQFAPRLIRLQEVRRNQRNRRQRLLRGLQQLLNREPAAPDAEIERRLEELTQYPIRAARLEHTAHVAIDEMLDVRQRVQFRLFELRMERRKLELVRQAGGARPNRPQERRQRRN